MFKKMFFIGLLFSIAVVLLPNNASAYHRKHHSHGSVVITPGIIFHPVHHRHHLHRNVIVMPSRSTCYSGHHNRHYRGGVVAQRRRW